MGVSFGGKIFQNLVTFFKFDYFPCFTIDPRNNCQVVIARRYPLLYCVKTGNKKGKTFTFRNEVGIGPVLS
jgi:hypothetical protein